MNSATSIAATRIGRAQRRPRTHGVGRVCTHYGCGVVLSRYNDAPTCRTHTSFRRPRVRGVKT